eukprot:jgi/Chrzof1/859/Cz01g31190.t1
MTAQAEVNFPHDSAVISDDSAPAGTAATVDVSIAEEKTANIEQQDDSATAAAVSEEITDTAGTDEPETEADEKDVTGPQVVDMVELETEATSAEIQPVSSCTGPNKHNAVKKQKPAVKKGKEAKDPNAPKKPCNAFVLFCNDKREGVKRKHPDWSVTDIGTHLGAMWREASEFDKKVYFEQAEEDKERYNQAMADYQGDVAE